MGSSSSTELSWPEVSDRSAKSPAKGLTLVVPVGL